jgi:hypothetical protein
MKGIALSMKIKSVNGAKIPVNSKKQKVKNETCLSAGVKNE